ncbi:MAG TPA: hypothetical protein VGK74_24500 [Symbiobacteriaceae bacterium]|jgi:hypothetical protein
MRRGMSFVLASVLLVVSAVAMTVGTASAQVNGGITMESAFTHR